MRRFANAMPTFTEFFRASWNHEPFPWQLELADRVVATGWPALLDVPTGLGKTAALDVFVWHLSSEAYLEPADRTAPTRAAFVIDRRLVVDSAFRRLRSLTRTLETSPAAAALAVAERLRSIGDTKFPLLVQRMRGGITWQSQWVRQPDQPAIVCGTVDQVGSRLLNRGYGSSASRMPIDSGLLGVDCVLIIDEAHLSSALTTTVRGVGALEGRSTGSPLRKRSGQIVKMTATSPEMEVDVLRVGPESNDVNDSVAGRRLLARKRTVLVEAKRDSDVTSQLVDLGRVMVTGGGAVVLVVCNTVKRARAVYEALKNSEEWKAQLLIGRCRDLERKEAEPLWFDRSKADGQRSPTDIPLILVSTQTVEVGVDLDVDSLVTEVASADALVQRFGRVDRLGRMGETLSAIVACPVKLEEAPVYGPSAAATWSRLTEVASPLTWTLPRNPEFARIREDFLSGPSFDAGPLAFRELIDGVNDRGALFATAPPAPVVIRPTLDCWARTSPIPDPDEAVGPYLHGVDRINPVVSVAWRAGGDAGDLENSLASVPIRSDELVEIPLVSLKRFLYPSKDLPDGDALSDLESYSSDESIVVHETRDVCGLIVRSRTETFRDLRMVRPGDMVVLPSSSGGHDDGGWTGRPGGVVADVADVVDRVLIRLRLSVPVLESFGLGSAALAAALRPFEELGGEEDPTAVVSEFLAQLLRLGADIKSSGSLAGQALLRGINVMAAVGSWRIDTSISYTTPTVVVEEIDGDDAEQVRVRGLLLTMRRPDDADSMGEPEAFVSDVDDDGENGEGSSLLSSIDAGADLSLLKHSIDVGSRAQRFSRNLGLSSELIRTLAFAGFLHDLGKAEVRFQAMLHRGDLVTAEAKVGVFSKLVAKSDIEMSDMAALRYASSRSGWPGLRHEAISLALAQRWPESEQPEGIDRELALYLVATHHGYGRPWFPADREDRAPTSIVIDIEAPLLPEFARRGSRTSVLLSAKSDDGVMAFDQPERCRALREVYGFWGLSYLEAVLRLADMTVSEELGEQLIRGGKR